jgi:hypothetical protein
LPEIGAVFVAAVPILQKRRRQLEEDERRRREEEMQRYQERQEQLRQGNRQQGFLELASRWRQIEDAHQFLQALAARSAGGTTEPIGDRTLDEWITWVRERLAAHDPLEAGPVAIFRQSPPSINGPIARTRGCADTASFAGPPIVRSLTCERSGRTYHAAPPVLCVIAHNHAGWLDGLIA